MSGTTHKPSIDPADEGDLLGSLRHILGKELQNLDGMLPAKVIAYDRAKNRATVQPLVMLLTTSNTTVARATLASVPVYQIGGGGFILNFNLKAGDLGWIKASDRDISLFLQSYAASAPNTIRKHSFSDAVFYPDVMKGYTIAGEDAENAVLQNLDGSVKLALAASKMTLKVGGVSLEVSGGGVTITGGTITHNGKNIGDTHAHSGVTAGIANTGVPV